jgi:hypothetical protein
MCRSTLIAVALASLLAAACDAPSEPGTRADIRPDAARAAGVHGGADEVEEPGTEHYQCCIHPWMRATVIAN